MVIILITMPVMNARGYQQGCCSGYLITYIFVVLCTLGTVTCSESGRPSTAYNPPPKPLDNPYPRLLHERDVIHYLDWHGKRAVIGSGSYADVSMGELRGQETHVVVKTFMDSAFKSIVKEVRMHRYVEKLGFTPRFIGLLPTGPLAANISLVYEYIPFSKSLNDWLDEPEDLTNIQWLQICLQTASIMLRLHHNHVLFNDLHRSNILVQKCDGDVRVFYIDFGLATYKQGKEYTSSYDSMKEHKFLAPELRKDTLTSKASDVFALGYNLYKIAKTINNTRLLHLSHWCNETEPSNRPELVEVISTLDTILFEISGFKHDVHTILENTDESFNESFK